MDIDFDCSGEAGCRGCVGVCGAPSAIPERASLARCRWEARRRGMLGGIPEIRWGVFIPRDGDGDGGVVLVGIDT